MRLQYFSSRLSAMRELARCGVNVCCDPLVVWIARDLLQSKHEKYVFISKVSWKAAEENNFEVMNMCQPCLTMVVASNVQKYGRIDAIFQMNQLHIRSLNSIMEAAAQANHKDIVRHCYRLGAKTFNSNSMLTNAARDGNNDMLRLFASFEELDLNQAMRCAASAGRVDTVRLCHHYGADDVMMALVSAAESGQVKTFRTCIELQPKVDAAAISRSLVLAAQSGKLEIIQICQETDIDSSDLRDGNFRAMCAAAAKNQIDAIRLCYDCGARENSMVNGAMVEAARIGNVEAARMCRLLGAQDYQAALVGASKGNSNLEMLQLVEDWATRHKPLHKRVIKELAVNLMRSRNTSALAYLRDKHNLDWKWLNEIATEAGFMHVARICKQCIDEAV